MATTATMISSSAESESLLLINNINNNNITNNTDILSSSDENCHHPQHQETFSSKSQKREEEAKEQQKLQEELKRQAEAKLFSYLVVDDTSSSFNNNNISEKESLVKEFHALCRKEFADSDLESESNWVSRLSSTTIERQQQHQEVDKNLTYGNISTMIDPKHRRISYAFVLVKHSDTGKVVAGATVEFYHDSKCALLGYVVVTDVCRGKGIVGKILETALSYFSSFSMKHLFIDVFQVSNNLLLETKDGFAEARQKIWGKLGFIPFEIDLVHPDRLIPVPVQQQQQNGNSYSHHYSYHQQQHYQTSSKSSASSKSSSKNSECDDESHQNQQHDFSEEISNNGESDDESDNMAPNINGFNNNSNQHNQQQHCEFTTITPHHDKYQFCVYAPLSAQSLGFVNNNNNNNNKIVIPDTISIPLNVLESFAKSYFYSCFLSLVDKQQYEIEKENVNTAAVILSTSSSPLPLSLSSSSPFLVERQQQQNEENQQQTFLAPTSVFSFPLSLSNINNNSSTMNTNTMMLLEKVLNSFDEHKLLASSAVTRAMKLKQISMLSEDENKHLEHQQQQQQTQEEDVEQQRFLENNFDKSSFVVPASKFFWK